MTKSEHEKERRAFWDRLYIGMANSQEALKLPFGVVFGVVGEACDMALAERDKRFPAPESGEK